MADLKPGPVVEPLVRFETEPGQQMQVNFVVMRRGSECLSVFGATLGYSRLGFVYFVTDERGYRPFGREGANLLFQVIAKRYERGSIIIISSLSFSDWATALADDAMLTGAPLDRLLHHGHIVSLRSESYRMKN